MNRLRLVIFGSVVAIMIGSPVQSQVPAGGAGTGVRITDQEAGGQEVVNVPGYIPQGGVTGAVRTRLSGGTPEGRSGYPEGEVPEEQEVLVWVKEGKVVYCSYCRQLLHYDVQFKQVRRQEVSRYYDDGRTHNDEVANDGVPSNIEIVDSKYICEYCYSYAKSLRGLASTMSYPGPMLDKSQAGVDKVLRKQGYRGPSIRRYEQRLRDGGQVHPLAPLAFYSIGATSLNDKSEVTPQGEEETRLRADISVITEGFVAPYQHALEDPLNSVYLDYTKERKTAAPPPTGLLGQDQFQSSRFQYGERTPYGVPRPDEGILRGYQDGMNTIRRGN